jgi:hypothetical protein
MIDLRKTTNTAPDKVELIASLDAMNKKLRKVRLEIIEMEAAKQKEIDDRIAQLNDHYNNVSRMEQHLTEHDTWTKYQCVKECGEIMQALHLLKNGITFMLCCLFICMGATSATAQTPNTSLVSEDKRIEEVIPQDSYPSRYEGVIGIVVIDSVYFNDVPKILHAPFTINMASTVFYMDDDDEKFSYVCDINRRAFIKIDNATAYPLEMTIITPEKNKVRWIFRQPTVWEPSTYKGK